MFLPSSFVFWFSIVIGLPVALAKAHAMALLIGQPRLLYNDRFMASLVRFL
jgi:hypothetical protein